MKGMGVPERREMKRHRRHNLRDRFEILKTLGQGTYGKVKLAMEKSTGIQFAIKSIRKKKIETEQDLKRVRREIEIMATLYHPHITTVHEVFENRDRIVLVMDYAAGGELYDYINERKGLYEDEARKFFRQMASAVHYLHANGIVHRDLKLENILLDEFGNIKLVDFGLSNVYGNDRLLNTFCGSPLYASPEIVNGNPYYGPEVDCWSLGVVLYTLVYGAMPFDGSDFKRLKQQITDGEYLEPKTPSDATGLIKQLLCPNPGKRANVDDICVHWWVNFGYEQNPAQLSEACSGRVDRNSLVESLKSDNASDSDSENPNPLLIHNSHKKQASRPLKGILKKPRDNSSHGKGEQGRYIKNNENKTNLISNGVCDSDRLKKPRSNCELNSDWLIIHSNDIENAEYKQESLKKSENRKSAPVNCDITKTVFDSTKKPKKSILKNRSGNSRSDSGCVIDEQINIYTALENFEVVIPGTNGDKRKNSDIDTTRDSQRDSAYIERKQSCDSEVGSNNDNIFDLNDIESVLDDIVNFEVATEKRLHAEATKQGYKSNGLDIHKHSLFQNPQENFLNYTDVPSTCNDYVDYDPLKEPVKYRNKTSTPNRQLKGILKRNSRSKENSWRYSLGSQGSNSSGDILDFSYDSMDGEYFMQEFCAVPIPLNDEEEQEILINDEENIVTREELSVDPVQEPWSEFDIMPWQEVDVPLNDSLLRKSNKQFGENVIEMYDNVPQSEDTEQYDNVKSSLCSDNQENSNSEAVTGNNTLGEESAIIDLKLEELNVYNEKQHLGENNDFGSLVGNLNESLLSLSSDTPPPLPVRPPPIGAPASPVRYRVTPPATPPPPLPETPPPPFKAFELDIFELDMLSSEFDLRQNKADGKESLAVELVNSNIECIDYDKVFDALEKQAEIALSKSSVQSCETVIDSEKVKNGLDQKLLAKMQGYFETPEPMDMFIGRKWKKSYSAQALAEMDEDKVNFQAPCSSRPLSKDLDIYNLELWHAIENTKLHISEDDLISIRGLETPMCAGLTNEKQTDMSKNSAINSGSSSSPVTEDEIMLNINQKMLLHIDSVETEDTNTTGNESLARSSREELDKLESDMIELYIEEDTMQRNLSEPAFEMPLDNNTSVFIENNNADNSVCSKRNLSATLQSTQSLDSLLYGGMDISASYCSTLTETAPSRTLNDHCKLCTTEQPNLNIFNSSWENVITENSKDAGLFNGSIIENMDNHNKMSRVQLSDLVISEHSSTDILTCSDKNSQESMEDNLVYQNDNCDINGSYDLHIDEDNLLNAIVSDVNINGASALPDRKVLDRASILYRDEGNVKQNHNDSNASNAHYLDDIMKSIDKLGEQLDCELVNNSAYSSKGCTENILVDFEEASEVCRQALQICENLE